MPRTRRLVNLEVGAVPSTGRLRSRRLVEKVEDKKSSEDPSTPVTRAEPSKNEPRIKKPVPLTVTSRTAPSSTPVNVHDGSSENKKARKGAFPARLQWKMSHLKMPTTSTPKQVKKPHPREVTKRDIDTAFGFDESCNTEADGNYSTLISPIAYTASPNRIIPPVWKVHPLSQRNVELDPPPKTKIVNSEALSRKPDLPVAKVKSTTETKSADLSLEDTIVCAESDPCPHEEKGKNLPDPSKDNTSLNEKAIPAPKPKERDVSVITLDESKDVQPKPKVQTKKSSSVANLKPRRSGRTKKQPVRYSGPEEPSDEDEREEVVAVKKPKTIQSIPEPQKPKRSKKPVVAASKGVGRSRRTKSTAPVVEVEAEDEYTFIDNDPPPPPPSSEVKVSKPTKKRVSKTPKSRPKSTVEIKKPIRNKRLLQIDEHPEGTESSPFSQLLGRYHDDEEDVYNKDIDDLQLHVDPKKVFRTYGSSSRKRVKFSEDRETEFDFATGSEAIVSAPIVNQTTKSKPKSTRKKKTKSSENDELDDEAKKWMEEKNKEFEDLLKVPLVIENSFSD